MKRIVKTNTALVTRRVSFGFSLLETLVVIALTGSLVTTLAMILVFFYRTNATVIEQTDAITSARRGVEKGVRDIREATYGEDGSYPIVAAGTSTITFFSDKDQDTQVERVRFALIGTTLYRYTIEPTGNPLGYTNAEATEVISEYVRNASFNTNLFTYKDINGNTLGSSPAPIDIASVTVILIVNVNPNRAPEEFTLTSTANLRNLRIE
jgi:type II secretory pathway pseudopilin PulG